MVWGCIGRMGVPKVHVEKPIIIFSFSVKPIDCVRQNLIGAFAAKSPH